MSVPVSMIAAVAGNMVIGNKGEIPWRIPADMAFFRRTTMGKPLIVGRKTFEGFKKPLPGRTNIVVTHDGDFRAEGAIVVPTMEKALSEAQRIAAATGADEVMVGGGGHVYADAIGHADRLYVTHVEAEPIGDAHFPAIDPDVWQVVAEPQVAPDPRDSAEFRINVYERRSRR